MKKTHFSLKLIPVLIGCGCGLYSITTLAETTPPTTNASIQQNQTMSAEQQALLKRIARGEYVARLGDCGACHTDKGGQTYAGGLKMNTPFGAIYSTNITPDKTTGIGNYRYDDFVNAVRYGIAKDGHRLYPAMPYPSFTKITDEDMHDLYAYIIQGVKPVMHANKPTDIHWPMNMRWPLAVWDLTFRHDGIYQPDAQKSAEWNRGAYIVQSLGHCGSCHTPRGIGFQEKALDQSDNDYLTGASLEGWHAPNLTQNAADGLSQWNSQKIVQFLKTGHTPDTAAFGSMSDAITNSTQYMTDSDLHAIATYLGSLNDHSNKPLPADQKAIKYTQDMLVSGDMHKVGAQLYMDNCATCHRTDGLGYQNTFPALAFNPAVLSDDPSSLISIILKGSQTPVTEASPTGLTMPDFAWRLTDQQAADVLNFVRSNWGNSASTVTAKQIAEIRETLPAKE